jgi:hypothetical protein
MRFFLSRRSRLLEKQALETDPPVKMSRFSGLT